MGGGREKPHKKLKTALLGKKGIFINQAEVNATAHTVCLLLYRQISHQKYCKCKVYSLSPIPCQKVTLIDILY